MRGSLIAILCAGCALAADLGEERTLQPGSGGSGGAGAAAGNGGGGDLPGAGAGGAGGEPATGGADGLLYFQDFEATSESPNCSDEEPEIGTFPFGTIPPDCDHAPALAGEQSAHFVGARVLFCDECLGERQTDLWAEFLLRADQSISPNSWYALVYTNGAHHSKAMGSGVVWANGDHMKIQCFNGTAEYLSSDSPVLEYGQTYLVTHHHDWTTHVGEFWVREVDARGMPRRPREEPTGSVSCNLENEQPPGLPTSFYSYSPFDAEGGEGSIDNLTIARTAAPLTP